MTNSMTAGTVGREPPGLLLDMGQLVVLLRRSAASLERDQAAGRLPAPVYLGGSRRWRRAEIEAWVAAGCPAADVWARTRSGDRAATSDGEVPG